MAITVQLRQNLNTYLIVLACRLSWKLELSKIFKFYLKFQSLNRLSASLYLVNKECVIKKLKFWGKV